MDALMFLQSVVGKEICYAIKSPDVELYDFGFGKRDETKHFLDNCTHILHVLCRFKIMWKNKEYKTERYYEDTDCAYFHLSVQKLLNHKIKRVALSDKNDLWIDFGHFVMVFVTNEDGEESWRLFIRGSHHLVATDQFLDMQEVNDSE